MIPALKPNIPFALLVTFAFMLVLSLLNHKDHEEHKGFYEGIINHEGHEEHEVLHEGNINGELKIGLTKPVI